MRMELGFRLSSYLTLGLACLCLGYAEQIFLPGIAVFVLPVLLLLVVAFFAEGRWFLPIWASNLLGLVIAAGSGLWITLVLVRPGVSPLGGIPMPVALLPYLGPLLTILLMAKLFRPKKATDLWVLQGMGLLQVALGCVLANDFVFGILLIAYLACALWFLALFHVQREQMGRPLVPVPVLEPCAAPPGRRERLYPVGRWTLAVTGAGILLFLLIPRFGATQWHLLNQLARGMPDNSPAQVGFSEIIDLNRTGTLQIDNEVALTVSVTDANGNPKEDLSPQQRWRGIVLDRYHDGRWLSSHFMPRWSERQPPPEMVGRRPGDSLLLSGELPDLGPRQYFFDFKFDPQFVGGLILAEPVVLRPGDSRVPVMNREFEPWPTLYFLPNDWTLASSRHRQREEVRYRQVAVPLEEPNLSLPVGVSEFYRAQLITQRGFSLKGWTDQLLRDLAAQSASGLSDADLQYEETDQGRALKGEYREKVARALCQYLATSGEYTYTLDLRRHDRRLDPTEDFLRNVKQGHCERFAAALALMLRSQGIPARVVKGFRGGEHLGGGQYALRHSDAHSWVEALIPRPQPSGQDELHWLTLDPTSSIDAPTLPRFSVGWWMENSQEMSRMAWKDFVVEYDIDQQAGLWKSWRSMFADGFGRGLQRLTVRLGPWLALICVAVVGFWLMRRYRISRGTGAQGRAVIVFYAQLLAILARRCRLRPEPAQTPREFGETARQALQRLPGAAVLADLPARVANLFYRVRYGQQPLTSPEEQDLRRQLEQLDGVLAKAK